LEQTPPFRKAPDDRLSVAKQALAAPRRYVQPWYTAYLLLGMVTAGLLPVLLPLAIEARSGEVVSVAYVMGTYNLGLLTSPLWGMLAERGNIYRRLFPGTFLITGFAVAAMSLSSYLPTWIALAFALGAGAGGAATLATLFVVDFAPRLEWESRIGWLQSFNGSGQVAGLLLASTFSAGQFAAGLWVAAGSLLPAMLMSRVGLPRSGTEPPFPHREHIHTLDIRTLSIFPRINSPSGLGVHIYHLDWRGLERLPRVMGTPFGRFLLSWFLLSLGVAGFFSYFPLMLKETHNIAVRDSAIIYAVSAALGIGLYVLTSHLTSRYTARRVYHAGLILRIVGFALLSIPVLTSMVDRSLLGMAGFAFIVLAWPILSVSGTDLAARLTPFSEGAAMGMLNAALALATAIGTIITGALVHLWGYGAVLEVAFAGLVVSLLLRIETPEDGSPDIVD
jgi:MFS family permease